MASRSRSHKTPPTRVADFETTTDPDDCRVWAWASISVNDFDDYVTGSDIESFIGFISREATVTYFHNLAFDGVFIIDYIMRDGYTWVKESPGKGEFTTLISLTGKFYNIVVVTKNGVRTEFRDSLKKIPLSVENIARSFNLDIQKLEIDYDRERPVGYKLTQEEKDYLKNDVAIVAQALRVQLSAGMKKLTVGADALNEYKTIIGKKNFSRVFPVLSQDIDSEIRKAYRGGFTYANPRFCGILNGPGKVYDVNSLYPSVMYDRPIPVGTPVYHDGAPPSDSGCYIMSITFRARVREGMIPCIQVKKSPFFSPTQYQNVIDEPVTISCTNVDFDLWSEYYELDIISYNGSFTFSTETGVFTDYIDKWMAVKKNSSGGTREIAKLHLNSLYGKFATNPNATGKYPVIEDGIVKLKTGEHEERAPVYTPAGVFITAYARDTTVRAAQKNYGRFAYADTDSLHLIGEGDPAGIVVDSTALGAWKHEADFTESVYTRAKQYSERLSDGSLSTHIAGLPASVASQITPQDLLTDQVWGGKLVPRKVHGGVVLEDTTFTYTAYRRNNG